MASNAAVWGIDIGQCGLKAIKLQLSGDAIEMAAFDYVEHAKILSQPDAERPALIRNALETFLSRNDVTGDGIFVSVPGQQTFSRFTKLPPVEPKRIPEIVQFEASQQIPFDMDAVVWDYQIFTDETSPDVEVGIFAMKRDLIRKALEPLTELELQPIGVQAGPLALYNALKYDGYLEGGGATIIVDVGAENSDLIVAEGDSIWTRNVPLGGNNFTESLVKAFKLSFAKAESLKRTAASSKYARQIFQAMRPVFADLVAEIQRSIGFYTSTHRHAKLERCIGMGNAFKLPGLQKFLQQNLSLPVQLPASFKRLGTSQTSGAPEFMEHILTFGTAYGLAAQGLGVATVNSSLLPPEVLRQAMWRKKRVWFGAAAACLVVSALGIWSRYVMDQSALARTRGSSAMSLSPDQADRLIKAGVTGDPASYEYADQIRAAAEALASEYQQRSVGSEDERQKMERILDLEGHKVLWMRILETVHRSLPQPQHELRDAGESADAVKAAYARVPRPQRTEIYIDTFQSEYTPNVNEDFLFDDMDDPLAAGGASEALPGFWVTLQGWTPNAGGYEFIDRNFLKPLVANSLREKAGFYFDKVEMAQFADRLKAEAGAAPGGGMGLSPRNAGAGVGRFGAGGGGGRGAGGHGARGGGGRGAPRPFGGLGGGLAAGSTSAGPQYEDPLLRETMDKDFKFEITFHVVLGDPPAEDDEGTDAP